MDVITTHINADFDCLGAMIAARRLYPDAVMVFPGAQERSLREFFLQSAFYAYEFKRLREIDLEAIRRLILVDVCQADRIGPFGEVALRPDVELHIFDHHPNKPGALHGTVEVVRPVGATVTLFVQLFRERNIVPTPDEATMMLLGLYEDTGKLLSGSTTVHDFEAAAFLVENGGNLNTVADFLVQELTSDQVGLLHELLKSLTALNVNGIDVHIAHASIDYFVGDLAILAHKIKDMEGLDALIVAVRMADRIFMVGRSRLPEVHVGEILGEFGGGGHGFAASASVRRMTLVQVLDELPVVLRRLVNPHWEARHLMFSPVKTVPRSATIEEVRAILTRYNINAVPVMDGDRVVGVITRQVAEKAAHHRLSGMLVEEYMSTDFAAVRPQTSLAEVQDLIVERHQRFVPVLEDGRLVGALTRTDLLRYMVYGAAARRAEMSGNGLALRKRDVLHLLKNQLPLELQQILGRLGAIADELQVHIFLVGGFVRDLLLRQENLDLDLVVEGDGIAFAERYAASSECRVRAHRKFGTAVMIFPDGLKIDVASARTEYYLQPGALPMVEHASIKLDLYRRDFTINTLAVALNGKHFGELLDYFGGLRDLQERAIRVLHNLSFVEDPTRMFRAVRFEQRLGFQIGGHSEHLLRSAVRMGFLEKISGPRIFNELMLIFRENDPLPAVRRLDELGLLKAIHPGLALSAETRELLEAGKRAVDWYELLYTGEGCQRGQVLLLCLLGEMTPEEVSVVVDRLVVPDRYRTLLLEQRRAVQDHLQGLEWRQAKNRPPGAVQLYEWFHDLPIELLLYAMAITDNEACRRLISHFITRLRDTACLLGGRDLQDLGVRPGPVYKEIFRALLHARLEGRVVTREDEVALVRKRFLPSAAKA
jgi:tRNA nucleotidyltransferase (CCA-adding enzyme)